MVLRMRGGGPTTSELGIAAGGLIKQDVRKDTRDPQEWVKGLTLPVRVQILDSSTFRQVTGQDPPACPIDAETVRSPEKSFHSSVLCTFGSLTLFPPLNHQYLVLRNEAIESLLLPI